MKKRINNERFTIRFCNTMQLLGIKTVGGAKKFLDRVDESLAVNHTYGRTLKLELDIYLKQEYETWKQKTNTTK